MALTKIEKVDYNGKGVVGLPDSPQLSTTAMQEKFDELATDVIIPKHNQLVDELESESGASNVGTKNGNVQSDLDALEKKIQASTGDVSDLVDSIEAMQIDVTNLKTADEQNKANISSNTTEIEALKTADTEIEAIVSQNTADISENTRSIASNTSSINSMNTKVTELEGIVSSVDGKITANETAIAELKKNEHTHSNKTVLDGLSKDTDTGNLMFEGNPIESGSKGMEDAFAHVKVGATTIDATGSDTFEFVAGSNVTLGVTGKQITVNAAGGGGGTSTGDMLKSDFVLPGGNGQVLSAKKADEATHATSADSATHATSSDTATKATSADTATTATKATNADNATNADHATSADSAATSSKVGNADTEILEALSKTKLTSDLYRLKFGKLDLAFVSDILFKVYDVLYFKMNGEVFTISDELSTKLSKLLDNGTINYADVNNKPTIPTVSDNYSATSGNAMSGKAVASALDKWYSQTPQATATGEQSIVFTGIDTTKAYELWFNTSNGSQVGLKSSSLSGTTMTYVVDIPSDCPVPVTFKLREIK